MWQRRTYTSVLPDKRLVYSFTTEDNGLVLRRHRTNACQSCAIKRNCATAKERLISRWEHEAVLETVQARLDRHPEKMTVRRSTAEHPFGTIKCWMGATALSHETPTESENRDGAQCARLQTEAGDGDPRRGGAAGGPGDVSQGFMRLNQRIRMTFGTTENGFQGNLHSIALPAPIPSHSHTAWARRVVCRGAAAHCLRVSYRGRCRRLVCCLPSRPKSVFPH
jgi:hypothetical protein